MQPADMSRVRRSEKENSNGHQSATFWLTGLSGAGKSTIAFAAERILFEEGIAVNAIDGDELRQGLCSDLDFSPSGRAENVRRASETCLMFNNAGAVVICALISPFRMHREMARQIIGVEHFYEVFIDAPLDLCLQRDPKGLYRRAIEGTIPVFTGISDPYERPENPALHIHTKGESPDESVGRLVSFIRQAILP